MRNSSIELLRLLAMLMILGAHANYVALKGAPEWSDFASAPFGSFFRVFFEQVCIVGVNVFILISGWFGIRAKKERFLSLLFQVFTISMAICLLAPLWGETVEPRHIVKTFVIGSEYWFVIAYLILYSFAPILNNYFERVSKKEFQGFLILFYLFSTVYGFLANDAGHFYYGYSAISFIGLYSLARYIRMHGGSIFTWRPTIDILIYLLLTVLTTGIAILQTRFNRTAILRQIDYNNPLVIVAAVYLFLAFTKIRFKSGTINWLAQGAFAIYIIHYHPLVFDHYVDLTAYIYNSTSGLLYIITLILTLISISLACILVDRLRMLLWKPIARLLQ